MGLFITICNNDTLGLILIKSLIDINSIYENIWIKEIPVTENGKRNFKWPSCGEASFTYTSKRLCVYHLKALISKSVEFYTYLQRCYRAILTLASSVRWARAVATRPFPTVCTLADSRPQAMLTGATASTIVAAVFGHYPVLVSAYLHWNKNLLTNLYLC